MSKIKVFYNPLQVAYTKSFSKSPSKPKLVVENWLAKFPDAIEIVDFVPVTREQLKLVHSDRYVDGVLDLTVPNGFGNMDKQVAESLVYTSGSMLAAARCALEEGIAVSPTSGYHHACHNGGGGFCTFEGLTLTAEVLRREGLVNKVGILDCDYHAGNGSVDIIRRCNLRYIKHYSAGYDYQTPDQASHFMNSLKRRVESYRGCDVLLVQLGADPYIDDPLGGFLSFSQLQERDRIIFEVCKHEGIPVVFNLAGGYCDDYNDTIKIHINSMTECIKVYYTD